MEYTLTVVTQEREVHVITSPAVTWRKTERGAAWRPGTEGAYPSGMESSAPMCASDTPPACPSLHCRHMHMRHAQRIHLVQGNSPQLRMHLIHAVKSKGVGCSIGRAGQSTPSGCLLVLRPSLH